MPEMPTLGAPPKNNPPIVPIAITAIVVGLLLGGIFWLKSKPSEPAPEAPAADPLAAVPSVDPAAPAPAAVPLTPVPPTTVAPIAPTPSSRAFTVTINGPLESAIVASEGKEVGTALTQVVNRSLVWWVRVPQDLVKGDTLSVVYETRDGQEPLVHAVRFSSRKHGREFETYRFKGAADPFARFYLGDGSELEERLADSPIESYEQITSLLRDGRKHKGVDFKAPSGTPVKATFDAVVARKNWNFRGNGNSVELEEVGGSGRTALYLHLTELPKSLAVGQRIKRGETFAKSGNTGRSFAPHLHYQLMKGGTVLDPFDSQKTTRAALPQAERPAFERRMNELKAQFPATTLAGG